MSVPPKIIIAHHRTIGLARDAEVLSAAILQSRPAARILDWTLPDWCLRDATPALTVPQELVREGLPCDLLILLEHAFANPPLLTPSLARRVVYVPNIEWILPQDEAVMQSGAIDAVLLKTRHAHDVFQRLPSAAQLLHRTHHVGWTSCDPGRDTSASSKELRCLHTVGTSVQKDTDAVVAAWMGRPDFPPLTVTAMAQSSFTLPRTLFAAPNLRFHLAPLADEEMHALQRAHGIHVCPSMAEGFGHSINEARAAGALVITTDAPPMNELVQDGWNGLLVPVDLSNAQPYRLSTAYRASAQDIARTMERAMVLDENERFVLGQRARAAFEEQRRQFGARVSEFLDEFL